MFRAALRFAALVSIVTPCTAALAHGEPPAAYLVLSHDAEGARALRLSHGVALRRGPKRYQFVCPSAWGDMYAAPVAALADGTIVVGATSGLKLLGQDGKVRVHPDPVAAGSTGDIIGSAHGVFSVRNVAAGSELLAVDAEHARVLWSDSKNLYSLAALDDKLVLLRGFDIMLEQVTVAMADGKELERQVAMVTTPIDYAFARAAAGTAYALVMFRNGTALGTLHMNAFTRIAQADLSVAGPLRIGESLLLAPDGKLSQLVGAEAQPLAEDDNVLCLGQENELSYACNPAGIARVSGDALSEPLFQLSWLVPPDLEALPVEARERCNMQWQDLRVDLMMAGTSLLEEAMPDAGGPAPDAGPIPDAGADAAVVEGRIETHDAGEPDAGQVIAPSPGGKADAGCSVQRSNGCNLAAYLYLTLLLFLSRRPVFRRSQPSGCARSDTEADF